MKKNLRLNKSANMKVELQVIESIFFDIKHR